MIAAPVMDRVQLINGQFSPSEASDLIKALIKAKINFHKLHRLSICEGDVNSDTSFDNSCIADLERELLDFRSLCQEARATGKKIRLSGILDCELIDQ